MHKGLFRTENAFILQQLAQTKCSSGLIQSVCDINLPSEVTLQVMNFITYPEKMPFDYVSDNSKPGGVRCDDYRWFPPEGNTSVTDNIGNTPESHRYAWHTSQYFPTPTSSQVYGYAQPSNRRFTSPGDIKAHSTQLELYESYEGYKSYQNVTLPVRSAQLYIPSINDNDIMDFPFVENEEIPLSVINAVNQMARNAPLTAEEQAKVADFNRRVQEWWDDTKGIRTWMRVLDILGDIFTMSIKYWIEDLRWMWYDIYTWFRPKPNGALTFYHYHDRVLTEPLPDAFTFLERPLYSGHMCLDIHFENDSLGTSTVTPYYKPYGDFAPEIYKNTVYYPVSSIDDEQNPSFIERSWRKIFFRLQVIGRIDEEYLYVLATSLPLRVDTTFAKISNNKEGIINYRTLIFTQKIKVTDVIPVITTTNTKTFTQWNDLNTEIVY